MSELSKSVPSAAASGSRKTVFGLNVAAAMTLAGLALVPKCPMCFVAWAGILSSLGLTLAVVTDALQGLFSVFLVAALACVLIQARRSRNYRPLLLCGFGIVLVLIGKVAVDSPLLVGSGLTVLVCYSFARLRLPPAPGSSRRFPLV